MIKKIAFLSLFCTISLSINGMLKQYAHHDKKKEKYASYCIPNDILTSVTRKTLENVGIIECLSLNELQQKQSECFIKELIAEEYLYSARRPTDEEKKYDCINYALAQVLGFKKILAIPLESIAISALDLHKYFKQTNKPKKNDLVVYTITRNAALTSHVSIFLQEDEFESKWGASIIARHKKSNLPSSYGKYIYFLTLKNKFRTVSRDMLWNLMEYDADANFYLRSRKLSDSLLRYYALIANSDTLTAQSLISMPLSTIELLNTKK